MLHLDKHSNFINQRGRLRYPDGQIVQEGDIVEYDGKTGTVVNFDRQTVNIRYDDGTSDSMINAYVIRKVASSDVVNDVVKDLYWIKRNL